MRSLKLPLIIAVLMAPLPLGCQAHYAYEIINDSPDSLTSVRVADPTRSFQDIDMEPYQGGAVISTNRRIPKNVELRWTRSGKPPRTVRLDTGLDCPGRPATPVMTVQYWIRADDSVRTRFIMLDPGGLSMDFVPCESDTERAHRLANEELTQAARAGDVPRIEAALERARLNPVGYFDAAPLHAAVAAGRVAAVRYLIQRGARIEIPQDLYSQSALVVAINRGHLEIAELLIASGADLNNVSSNQSPLVTAAEKGHARLVTLMLDRGANINLQALGQSALINATRAGHLAVVHLLLERGADPNTTIGGTDATALDIAEDYQRDEIAAALLRAGGKRGPPQ